MISNLFSNLNSGATNNVERIGDNLYTFNLILNNGTSRVGIKFAAVEELNIVDDLRYFYVYGSFIINYNDDPLEAFETFGGGPGGNKSMTNAYVFRGDGRDELLIDIMPQLKEQKCLQNYSTEGDKKKYNIKYNCIIYKYEDITAGKGKKQRKFYFWDRDYQILNDINIDYSTADRNKNNKQNVPSQSSGSNEERSNSNTDNSIFTSEALEDVMKKALVTTSGLSFSKGQWDKGSSKILYHSSTNGKAIDDLEYLLGAHVSDTSNYNLPCLLRKERYTNKYNLVPINKFYKGGSGFTIGGINLGGSGVVEDFYIGKIDGSSSGLTRSSFSSNSLAKGNFNFAGYNLIEDYTFMKIDAKDLQKYMTSYMVHSNDPRGFFSTDIKQNNLESVEKIYNQIFVSGNGFGGRAPLSNISSNKLREDNKNVQHMFVPESMSKTQRKSKGVNKSILNLFFKNTSISFRAKGNTLRQSGMFFTVNRNDGSISNSHDNSMLGKYMITYIRHEFIAGDYTNTIHGIKPYTENKSNLVKGL